MCDSKETAISALTFCGTNNFRQSWRSACQPMLAVIQNRGPQKKQLTEKAVDHGEEERESCVR